MQNTIAKREVPDLQAERLRSVIASGAEGLDWEWLSYHLGRCPQTCEQDGFSCAANPGSVQPPALQSLTKQFPEHPTSRRLEQLWRSDAAVTRALAIIEDCRRLGVDLMCWHENRYPPLLRNIFRPPLVLYVRRLHLAAPLPWSKPAVAIVGSRRADQSGVRISRGLATDCANAGVVVVSGLALGVDSAAHEGALDSSHDESTIAVLGHGHSFCYPRQNEGLAQRILSRGGMLITEYPPQQPPLPHQFLGRNRIIAALSSGVVVVQATAKSGSLATARFALDQGRDVLVLPGAIDDPRYEGSNRLLKDGAVLVTGAQDVLQIFPDLSASAPASARAIARLSPELSLRAEPLFVLLDEERFTPYESLLDRWDSPWPLDQLLVELEIEGAIERHPGNQFSRP